MNIPFIVIGQWPRNREDYLGTTGQCVDFNADGQMCPPVAIGGFKSGSEIRWAFDKEDNALYHFNNLKSHGWMVVINGKEI